MDWSDFGISFIFFCFVFVVFLSRCFVVVMFVFSFFFLFVFSFFLYWIKKKIEGEGEEVCSRYNHVVKREVEMVRGTSEDVAQKGALKDVKKR